ncbi:DUF2617 family protein [Actinocrinis puniceicyclus]|uniref:DUF2617 family protein n=1 Tax=Actinocrinis puniceicyclus TaxID=977794 RepID=A0A8J7WL70_9ACTN|nr:DUF2617 family protein [Actinocrinis puniceicyclus]MBS2962142.1 DUF2617 family protein [Actinocrinis puniceicyclus]
MLVELTTGYRDTNADELAWSMDLGPRPALAIRRLGLAPFLAELRLLGASHQVAVWWFGGSVSSALSAPRRILVCRETVARLPQPTVPLPRAAERDLHGWRYTIESDVRTCAAGEFGQCVAGIERRASEGLVGRHPGRPSALTGIVIRSWTRGLWWTTWHTYPQQRQVVTTLSLLRLE